MSCLKKTTQCVDFKLPITVFRLSTLQIFNFRLTKVNLKSTLVIIIIDSR